MKNDKKWYAIYTKPRWEKKVNQLLTEKGIDTYCPLNKVSRQWSDRVKVVHEPLFKSYVFTRISPEEMTNVRMTSGVLNFVYWNSKPAVVKDKEIELIKRFLDEYDNVELEEIEIKPSQKVIIKRGVFMEKEAEVIKVLNNKAVVSINSLGYRIVAQVKKSNLEVVRKQGTGW
ncbi:MAG: UpxY family transcription antiterminator [Sphingobacteriales bacterium]|nr:UpxY family transcription antiterminator [Sphingobacteriales bacterium]MBI3718054.1 UpxY family transcription antiterminator [Sphingobacteriales bacterium]